MDNMNMPASPVMNGDNEPADMTHGYYQNKKLAVGMTKYETVAMNILAAMCSSPARTQGYRQNAVDACKQADAYFAELEARNATLHADNDANSGGLATD